MNISDTITFLVSIYLLDESFEQFLYYVLFFVVVFCLFFWEEQ